MTSEGLLSLLPAVLAIGLALISRNVLLSLSCAVWTAGIIHVGGNPIRGATHAVEKLLHGAIADSDHVKILLFTLFVGGTVAVMARSGGTAALIRSLAKRARTRRSAQLITWLSGVVVFFDDYANCMVVGNALRPLCDKLGVSRAKLAYIVDSTAAPVATLALVSTWVGFEVGLIQEGLQKAGIAQEAYAFFVQGWGYRFYPILTVVFVGAIAWTGRDFGRMARAEANPEQGRTTPPGDEEVPASPARGWLAVLPIVALVGVTMWVLWVDGRRGLPRDARLFEILGNANGYDAMVRGSLAALALAMILSTATRALNVDKAVAAATAGMRDLFEALAILFLAWSLGAAMSELGTANHLVEALHTRLPAELLPTLVFLVAAVTSFATGTSFGTMAILMPVVLPLAFTIAPDSLIPLAASGSVLAGATFGDHCSPISDTTVLASIGSSCNHVVHVETQLPYAVTVGTISILFGTLPAGFGVSPWLTIPIGAAACIAVVRFVGKRPPTPAAQDAADAPA